MHIQRKTLLVTGSNGTVASYIGPLFSDWNIIWTNKTTMDITKKALVMRFVQKHKPSLIIHLAAMTNVDACEKDPRNTKSVNFLGTKHVAEAAKKVKATMIYVSTCAVFDGKKNYYTENDTPHPANVYGKMKYLGEDAIKKTMRNFYIIRTGWIIGAGKQEKKFIGYIMKQIRSGSKEISVVNDTFGSITYAKDLIIFMKKLLDKPYGTYHFASKGVCSRFDMAEYIVTLLNANVKIIPVGSDYFQSSFFAPRPKYEVVKSVKVPYNQSWKNTLKKYITHEW